MDKKMKKSVLTCAADLKEHFNSEWPIPPSETTAAEMIQNEIFRLFQIDYREFPDDAADMMGGFQPKGELKENALKRLTMYRPVAVIPAKNLEEVSAFGNYQGGDVLKVDRMHSLSVGDIVMDERDRLWVVASSGYQQLDPQGPSSCLGILLELDAAQAIVFRHLRLAASDLDGMKASEAGQNVGGPYEFDGMQTDEY